MERRRLYRSFDDRWIAGVAAGVADYFDVDPIIVRILWIISIPFTGGLSLLAYLIMIVAVPTGPEDWSAPSPWAPGGAPLGTPPGGSPFVAPADGAPVPPTDAPASGEAPGWTAPMGSGPAASVGPDTRWQRRQDRWQRRQDLWQRHIGAVQDGADRRVSGGLIFGLLLVLVGAVLVWKELVPELNLGLAWPTAIILFGVVLVLSSIGWRKSS